MIPVTHTNTFASAAENMQFDEQLLSDLQNGAYPYFFRYYPWQTPGLTLPKSVEVPEELLHYDRAHRSTGGGIVFHCPGDSVFSLGFFINDSRFPAKFKEKLHVISEWFGEHLLKEGFETYCQVDTSERYDRTFCTTYPNPFERYCNGHKVVAFAMKRTRDVFMVQGIIHRKATGIFFHHEGLSCFFTQGLPL